MQESFTEDDKKKVVDFLNIIAQKAKFELNTQEVIEYFKLLAHMQQSIIPKIDGHIFEVKQIKKAPVKKAPSRGKK